MTSKTKSQMLLDSVQHTAGIFSDMTVDGPEIGTLVVVVDRAKNLPNRKTIGKQDPYCAARLGKEAKKTNTDIRGGQTPKWDQELRFPVHDSPDYYQLKVSVFNDDKKTELIGEAWIDLRDIIVTGGGQSDQWHQLACKGKYAGEVRIEITYYDTRPKPEKPAVKAKPPPPPVEMDNTPSSGPTVGPRAMPKRRPLPSDPVTGKAPATPPAPAPAPAPAPSPVPAPMQEAVEMPPRPQPNPTPSSYAPAQPPLQQLEYSTPPAPPLQPRYQQPPEDHFPRREPSAEFRTPQRTDPPPQQYRTPERVDRYQAPVDERGYSPNFQQPAYDRYDDPQQVDAAMGYEEDRPPPPPVHRSRTGSNGAMNAAFQSTYDPAAKGTPPTMRHDVLRNEAHRHSVSASYPGRPTYKAYDSAPSALSQYSNPEQPSPPRHHSYDSSYDPSYRTMQATVEDVPESPDSLNSPFRRSGARLPHPHSQSAPQFDPQYEMTTSPAPAAGYGGRNSAGPGRYSDVGPPPPQPQHTHRASSGYAPSPAEVSPREPSYSAPREYDYGRHSETSLVSYNRPPPDQRAMGYRSELDDTSAGYAAPPVPPSLVPGVGSNAVQGGPDRYSNDRQGGLDRYQNERQAGSEHYQHDRQAGPDRYQNDRQAVLYQPPRQTQSAMMETPPRGRTMGDRGYEYDQGPPSAQYNAPASYNAGPPPQGRNQIAYSNGPSSSSVNVVIKSRAYSPNPPRNPSPDYRQQTIRRKSVSPAPPPRQEPNRRLSAVPFGPDSYDALNPSVAAKEKPASQSGYDEVNGKIITHDGREVDPSDHLPMDTWAPEPESREKSASTSPAARPSPSGAQPMPPSGRRPLRIAGRTQTGLPNSGGVVYGSGESDNSPPVPTGRNRLQKKAANRPSGSGAVPPFMSGANGSGFRRNSGGFDPTPLAPLPPQQDNFAPPRQLPRAATFDYVGGSNGENYTPVLYNGGRGMAPSIPDKVPLALPPPPGPGMSGAMQLHSSSLARRGGMDDGGYDLYGGGERWDGGGHSVLEEEMRQIDIGTGRSRRHAGRY